MTEPTKHTPGPWRVEEGTTVVWSTNCYDEGSGNVGCIVARAAQPSSWRSCRPTADEQVANAHLIASAPEMAEAIQSIPDGAIEALRNNQRQLDMDGVEVGVSRQAIDEVLAAIDAARSALAKARGEA